MELSTERPPDGAAGPVGGAAMAAVHDEAPEDFAREACGGPASDDVGGTVPHQAGKTSADAASVVGSPTEGLPAPAVAVLAALAGLLAVCAAVHCAMLFLSIAPANGVSTRYRKQIDAYVYPNFGQYWQLFAPNPLQQEDEVQARVLKGTGRDAVPGPWINLAAQDYAAVLHNPFPSHVSQNMVRRALDFYVQQHGSGEGRRPTALAQLSAEYLKRIALQRLGVRGTGPHPVAVQLMVHVVPVAPPPWSAEAAVKRRASYHLLPWWPVDSADCRGL